MIEWPEIINSTWSEYEHWMKNDRKNQIQFITKIPGIINTFLILFFTALDVVGPNFIKRFHLQEKKAFPERLKNIGLRFFLHFNSHAVEWSLRRLKPEKPISWETVFHNRLYLFCTIYSLLFIHLFSVRKFLKK